MEVEMILLNLTEEIPEKAKQEGREVVEVAVEADLIQQAVQTQPIQGHYQIR